MSVFKTKLKIILLATLLIVAFFSNVDFFSTKTKKVNAQDTLEWSYFYFINPNSNNPVKQASEPYETEQQCKTKREEFMKTEAYLIGKPAHTYSIPTECTSTVVAPKCNPPQTLDPTTNTCVAPNTDTNYTLLAPLPDGSGGEFKNFESDPAKNPCPFGKYLNIMIKMFFGIAGVLAVVMIVMGGIQYMTSELISSKEEGKKSITNAIFGLLLALGAWLILNTINPDLLNTCLNNVTPQTITMSPDYTPQTPINGKVCTNTEGGPYSAGADWKTIAGNSPTSAELKGVLIKTPECVKVGDQNCTSSYGLKVGTAVTIKAKCPTCDIIITGGTECWLHGGKNQSTTHHPNSTTVDIRATDSVNNFFAGTSSFPNNNKSYSKSGVSCVAETAGATSSTSAKHWHCGS